MSNEDKENEDILNLVKTVQDIDIDDPENEKNEKGFYDEAGRWVEFNEPGGDIANMEF